MTSFMTPDANNIYVGTGEAWFNRLDLSGNPTGWRHLGNLNKLEANPQATTIKKRTTMNAARGENSRIITGTDLDVDIVMDEFDKENLALTLLGQTAAVAVTGATVTLASLGNLIALNTGLDTGYQNITVTLVKSGATTLTVGTDYTVDSVSGLIMFPLGSSATLGQAITWSGSYASLTGWDVQALSQGFIKGAFRYRSSSDNAGPKVIVDIWKLQIAPSAAIALLSDNYTELTLKCGALMDTTKAVGQQFMRVRYI